MKIVEKFWKFLLYISLKRHAKNGPQAQNYTTQNFHIEGRRGNVVVQFTDGKTPHQFREAAEGLLKDTLFKIAEAKTLLDAKAMVNEAFFELSKMNTCPAPATISELQYRAFKNAMEKGWHDEPRTAGEMMALMHSEISEALEEVRNHRGMDETYYNPEKPDKPEGVPVELADCIIRIFDFCGFFRIDMEQAIVTKMAYNKSRSHRHGGKKL